MFSSELWFYAQKQCPQKTRLQLRCLTLVFHTPVHQLLGRDVCAQIVGYYLLESDYKPIVDLLPILNDFSVKLLHHRNVLKHIVYFDDVLALEWIDMVQPFTFESFDDAAISVCCRNLKVAQSLYVKLSARCIRRCLDNCYSIFHDDAAYSFSRQMFLYLCEERRLSREPKAVSSFLSSMMYILPCDVAGGVFRAAFAGNFLLASLICRSRDVDAHFIREHYYTAFLHDLLEAGRFTAASWSFRKLRLNMLSDIKDFDCSQASQPVKCMQWIREHFGVNTPG
jgi:hypothetical protein